jgi:hypothetical protein
MYVLKSVLSVVFSFAGSKVFETCFLICRSQWPRGLRRGPAAARMLRLRVRIQAGAWMSVSCECCVSGIVLCVGLITHPEESYWVWCF